MKFLLVAVNAKYIHSNPGIYSLAAYATAKNPSLREHIEIAEYTINHQLESILADLYGRQPDVIGFSCYIWNITYIKELIEEVHKILPHTQIWVGGPEVSYSCEQILLERPQLTGVIIAEGEQTFLELLSLYIEEKENTNFFDRLTTISGLALLEKEEGKIVYTKMRELTNLSEIPFLYNDLSQFENRIIYYESSRGCPFRCSYCLSSIDKTVRLRDIEIVKRELQFFLDQKVSQVKFVDRTFNCNKKHAMEIWQYILMHDNGITNFHFEVAADILDEQELSLLNQFRPGAVQLEIGVQSTNERTIDEIDRRMDVSKLKQIVKRLHAGRNIHIHLDLIAGLPYEDMASFENSFNEVFSMQPEQLQLGFLKVLKGSKMHEKSKEYGLVYTSRPPYEVLYTNWISYEEIHRLKQIEEMVEIYYNSNQFRTTLSITLDYFADPFTFFAKLADYYDRKGYFIQSPARSYRYQVLLSFLEETVLSSMDIDEQKELELLFKESLTMDLYLRENMKTRPAFCADLNDFKEESRQFYQKEAQDHRVLKGSYEKADARTLARMTHVERFNFDMTSGKRLQTPAYIVFDYEKRNPLTNDAIWYEISV